jgi:hypothetical protein
MGTAHPEKAHDLPYYWVGSSAPRWLHGTTRIVYPRVVKTDQVEIASYDTATGQNTILTDDGGRKDEVSGFFAPEHGGELLYAAQLDNQEICVYRELKEADVRIDEIVVGEDRTSAEVRFSLQSKGEWKSQSPSKWILSDDQWYLAF